jgi:hypothetical protein
MSSRSCLEQAAESQDQHEYHQHRNGYDTHLYAIGMYACRGDTEQSHARSALRAGDHQLRRTRPFAAHAAKLASRVQRMATDRAEVDGVDHGRVPRSALVTSQVSRYQARSYRATVPQSGRKETNP